METEELVVAMNINHSIGFPKYFVFFFLSILILKTPDIRGP